MELALLLGSTASPARLQKELQQLLLTGKATTGGKGEDTLWNAMGRKSTNGKAENVIIHVIIHNTPSVELWGLPGQFTRDLLA